MTTLTDKPRPGQQQQTTTQVKILRNVDFVHPDGSRLMRPGDVFELPTPEAVALVKSDQAEAFALVRVEQDGITIGNRVCSKGDAAWEFQDRAERLERNRAVSIVRPAPASRPIFPTAG